MTEIRDPSDAAPMSAASLLDEMPIEAVVSPEVADEEGDDDRQGSDEISAEIDAEISAEISADIGMTVAPRGVEDAPRKGKRADKDVADEKTKAAEEEASKKDDQDAISALNSLPGKLFARLCRRIPMRTFLPELERLDRAVFYRYFKGYRPQKIDAALIERVLRKEIFTQKNGLLAQLVIYNWDEAEWRLYGALQKHVKAINEDVEAIEAISDDQANPIMDALEAEFDKRDVFIATVINGVRVSPDYVKSRFGDLS